MRDRGVRVAAEQRGHAGRGDRGGLGHRQTALAHEGQGGRVVQDAREDGGGDLADAVTGDGTRGHVTEGRGGDQSGGDEQRLGDGGVTDLVRVGVRAVVHQVEVDGGREGTQTVLDTGEVEPGGQEAGRLGALAGSDEYEHSHTLSWGRARPPVGTGTKNGKGFCGAPTKG